MQTLKHFQNTRPARVIKNVGMAFALVLGLSACQTAQNSPESYQRLQAVQALSYGLQQSGWDRPAANPNRLPMSQPQPVQQAAPCVNPYSCPMQYYGR